MGWNISRLLLAVFCLSLSIEIAASGEAKGSEPNSRAEMAMLFEPPPEDATPRGTAGGASRGTCLQGLQAGYREAPGLEVTALMPESRQGLTLAERPTFFVAVAGNAIAAELSLWDEEYNGIYQTDLSFNDGPGIVSIVLPPDAPGLEQGKSYKWSLAVICDTNNRNRDAVVEGWIQRSEPNANLLASLEKAKTQLEKAALYAENGFWYDTVSALAEVRRQKPDDPNLAVEWKELLISVGLERIVNKPLIDCCPVEN
ncbi:MAG: DUF928 domain-containing protein [Oscillatoria sp. SIO1A7]|nr:DUF928 domain-containing protein [Oscillatoria sp. SIO1A7]